MNFWGASYAFLLLDFTVKHLRRVQKFRMLLATYTEDLEAIPKEQRGAELTEFKHTMGGEEELTVEREDLEERQLP